MNRSLVYLLAISTAALAAGACESSTSVSSDAGPVVALDSLRAADAGPLPCCAVDSAGASVTIVAGALTFRANAHYTDTVITPVGPGSAACQNGVAGVLDARTGLVHLSDGTSYLVIPCHVGRYNLSLTQRLDFRNGSSRMTQVTLSSGTYAWKRDTLSLVSGAGADVTATMSADTIIVAAPGHTYKFQQVAINLGL